jgi:hypothetical protein
MIIPSQTDWKHLLIEYTRKGKYLIICGDWNINFLQENDQVEVLQNILVSNDLINISSVSTRVTSSSDFLIGVIVTNFQIYISSGIKVSCQKMML